MMSRKHRFALILVLVLLAIGVGMTKMGWLLYTGGPYRGQLLDAETRQPLEGAVVLFYWERDVYGGAGGPVAFFLKAKEVLTDKEGRFHIPWFIGTSLNPLSVVLKPKSIFFYPGYGSEIVEVTPPDGEPFKDPSVVPMRKLRTRKERIRVVGGLLPGGVPDQAMPNLIRLINVESAALGISPIRMPPGHER
ncbi:MAG: hypothetical protein ACE5G5_10750 [Candidatus Methylomirabilales bacterium]